MTVENQPRADDVRAFSRLLRGLGESRHERLRDFFSPDERTCISRAPGRLDVMGGIADYSGSLVLQLPIAEATFAAVQRRADGIVRVVSLLPGSEDGPQGFEMSCADLERLAEAGYSVAGEYFRRKPESSWAAYVMGTILVLARERGVPPTGLRILLDSRVPEGKGVSSSAALEVATMRSVAGLLGVDIDGRELATYCQIAENQVVGAPCGIMDQMTSALGEADRLLALVCQPSDVKGHLDIPPGICVRGINSDVRHHVTGSDYRSVRIGAFMGYRIIADIRGLEVTGTTADGVLQVADPRWRGYLANVEPDEFAADLASRIPILMNGRAFLEKYGGLTDHVTRVDPDRDYRIRQPTTHAIEEHARVRRFAELLPHSADPPIADEMGALMYASHESYSACGLGSEATDHIVDLVRQAGPGSGIHGAKITGGGSGGTVAILSRADVGDVIEDIARRYSRATGREATVFSGSSSGAQSFGVAEVARLDDFR